MEERKEIAMKLDLGQIFFRHLERMSETSSKISSEGEVSNFKMQTSLLEAILDPYIVDSKKKDYAKEVIGWEEVEEEKTNLNNPMTQKKIGEAGLDDAKAKISVQESLLKVKGLMAFAVQAGIAPNYKPKEKTIGRKHGS